MQCSGDTAPYLFAPGNWADDEPVGELADGHHDGGEDEGRGVGAAGFDDVSGDNRGEDAGDVADEIEYADSDADFLRRCAALQKHQLVRCG